MANYEPSDIAAEGYFRNMAAQDAREANAYNRQRVEKQDAVINRKYQQEEAAELAQMAVDAMSQALSGPKEQFETRRQNISAFIQDGFNELGMPYDPNVHLMAVEGRARQLLGGGDGVYGNVVWGQTGEPGKEQYVPMAVPKAGGSLQPLGVPEGVSVMNPSRLMEIEQGNQTTLVDPRTGVPVGGAYPVNPKVADTPDYQASVIRAEEEAKAKVKKQKTFPKVRAMIQSEEVQHEFVNETIDNAIALAQGAAGFGDYLTWMKSSDFKTLANELETIKANIAFGKLQEMRQNSPTGGALGNVSDQENKRLEAVAGSLDQGMKPEILIRNLKRAKQLRAEMLESLRSGFSEDYAEFMQGQNVAPAQQIAPAQSGSIDDLVKKYGG